MLLGFTTLFITHIHAKIEQFFVFLAVFQTKGNNYNEVKCFNTDLYGENTTFILYFNVKNSRKSLN